MGIISLRINRTIDMLHSKNTMLIAGAILLMSLLAALTNTSVAQDQTRKHTVGELDNYYSLSLKYDISIDELKRANPGVLNPKPGDVLIIPQKGAVKPVTSGGDCVRSDRNRNAVYKVALLIPLYLEQLEDTLWADYQDPLKINELAPFRFIQFYHGFMMAADSLKKSGLNVEIYVYDVDHQLSKAYGTIGKPEMKKMDLIVGPFFKNTFPVVADFAKENEIPVVNPLSPRSDILEGNPFVFKLIPSVESQPEILAKLVKRDYSDHKIIFYIPSKIQQTELINQYVEAIEGNFNTGKRMVTVVDYASDSLRGFREYASLSKPNLVIVFAENEVLPAALLNKLSGLKNEYEATVIGIPEWEKFTNIETDYLISFKSTIFMASYTEYADEKVKAFVQAYRTRYMDEPLTYAISGFDAGYFFLYALMNYGKGFEDCLDQIRIPLLQNQLHFEKKAGGGYDNINWNVLQYFDYSLFKKSL